jgi:hypothetical protein
MNFNNTSRVIPIFPVKYFQDSVENNDEIKTLLVDKIMNDVQELKIPEGWFTNKLMTSFSGEKPGKEIFFGEDKTYHSVLEPKYAKCIDNFFGNGQIPYRVVIDEIWYNCYTDGEYQEQHDHLSRRSPDQVGPHFSCIHFLSFDKTRHKPVRFHDPIEQIRSTSIDIESLQYGEVNEYHHPDIEEGDFIMFPSHLIHSVCPSPKTLDYPRITIAMNITVLNYGSEGNGN